VSVGKHVRLEDLKAAERRHLDAQTALFSGIGEKNVAAPRLILLLGHSDPNADALGYVDAAAPRLWSSDISR
jgi:hypothetical protein